jgi:hypothetical protein
MTSLTSDQVRQEGITEQVIDSNGEKFCVDCKHLLGVRYKDDTDKWRCVHPYNMKENREVTDLVLGIKKYIRVYKIENIYELRELRPSNSNVGLEFCGKEGKWFEKYEEPAHPNPSIGGQVGQELEVFDEATLKANREKAEAKLAAIKARKLSKDDLNNL